MEKQIKYILYLTNDLRGFTYDSCMGSRQWLLESIKILNQSWEPVCMDIVG